MAAAKQALAGANIDAIQRMVENLRGRVSVLFVLDTLEWVRRGGRMDRLMPLIDKIARTLRVKPVVELREGEMHLLGVARSHATALARLEEEVRARLPVETVAIAYTRGRETAVDLAERLSALLGYVPADLMLREAGPAFAAHAGPNAIGAVVISS
jgi:DegV family protein with EDD domain